MSSISCTVVHDINGGSNVGAYEPQHVISNNVAF